MRMTKSILLKNGRYATSSHYIAGRYGSVHTIAEYYSRDGIEHSTQHGYSKQEYVTNKNIRELFKNAIFNGAIKHLYKFKRRLGYGDENGSWTYKLMSWQIVYSTSKPLFIKRKRYKTKEDITISYINKNKIKKYESEDIKTREIKKYVYKKQKNILGLEKDNDKHMTTKQYKEQFAKGETMKKEKLYKVKLEVTKEQIKELEKLGLIKRKSKK